MRALCLGLVLVLLLSGCSGGQSDQPGDPGPTDGPPSEDNGTVPPMPSGFACQPCQVATVDRDGSEPSIAINPTNPANIVVANNQADLERGYAVPNFQGPGWSHIGVRYTMDGGTNWSSTFIPYTTVADSESAWSNWCVTADPVLFFGPDGVAYLVGLGWACAASPPSSNTEGNVWMATSPDGGATWGEPMVVHSSRNPPEWPDKPWGGVSPDGSRLAVAWHGLSRTGQRVVAQVSDDGGATWSAPAEISTSAEEGGGTIPSPGVAVSDRGVHMAYRGCGSSGTNDAACLKVATAFDEAASSFNVVTVAEFKPVERLSGPEATNFWVPSIDFDATTGRLWVGWTAADGEGDDADAWAAYSDDYGSNWSDPIRLNDNPSGDGTDQFNTWVAAGDDGAVHAFFYDRRDDPDRNVAMRATYAYFMPRQAPVNVAASSTWNHDPDGDGTTVRFGEYQGVDFVAGKAAIAFTNTRDGVGQRVIEASVLTRT